MSTWLLFSLAATGIDAGWQPLESGGMEYIVQVEPELIETFEKSGYESELPPEVRDLRRIRISVGSEELPREGFKAVQPPKEPVSENKTDGDTARPELGPLLPDPRAKRLEQTVSYNEHEAHRPPDPVAAETNAEKSADRPWLPLIATLVALFTSLGGNVYLGWLLGESRSRCRTLLKG
jgi:hypothetical protein